MHYRCIHPQHIPQHTYEYVGKYLYLSIIYPLSKLSHLLAFRSRFCRLSVLSECSMFSLKTIILFKFSLSQHACTICKWGKWQSACKFQNLGYANIRFCLVSFYRSNGSDLHILEPTHTSGVGDRC